MTRQPSSPNLFPRFRCHRALGFGLVFLLLSLPVGCDDDQGDDDSASEEGPDLSAAPVRVAAVERGDISEAVESAATVTAERALTLRTETTGLVESLPVDEGDIVSSGALLARLDNPAARAEARRTGQDRERAEQDADALQGLFGEGFLSRREYDDALARLDAARTADDVAREALRQTEVRAPFAGTISRRVLQLGATVSAGQDAFELVDLTRLRVEISLPERELSRLREGQKVEITSEFQGEQLVQGEVSRLSPVVDPESGTFRVRIDLDPEQEILRPGMFVNVRILVDTHTEALLVDKRCLFYERGEPRLFVIRDDKAALVVPELGFSSPESVEVITGVALDDRVVMHGQSALKDGGLVEVIAGPGATSTPAEEAGADEQSGAAEENGAESE